MAFTVCTSLIVTTTGATTCFHTVGIAFVIIIYIADTHNHRVQKFNIHAGMLHTSLSAMELLLHMTIEYICIATNNCIIVNSGDDQYQCS